MKFSKITSVVAGLTVLAATLAPVQASALSTATMTLTGSTQSNGTFAVTVYENTGSDTVTGAKVEMSFSQAVSNVAYDYSVGPFTAVTPSGAHNAYGTVTGTNPVARVSFTLATPGTVTASVNANSYLKHASDTSVENFVINRGSADFTYTAPATGGQGGGSSTGSTGSTGSTSGSSSSSSSSSSSNGTKVATNSNSTSPASSNSSADSNKGETKDASTTADTKKSDDKKADSKNASDKSSSKTWLWILIAAIVAVVAYLATRKNLQARVESAKTAEDAQNVKAAEVVAPAAAAASEKTETSDKSKKNTSKKAKGNKKARSNRK